MVLKALQIRFNKYSAVKSLLSVVSQRARFERKFAAHLLYKFSILLEKNFSNDQIILP